MTDLSTPAGTLLLFAQALGKTATRYESFALFHSLAFATNCKPFTRNFSVALEGLRDAADRTKRWLDTNYQTPDVASRYAEAVVKIRYHLDAEQLGKGRTDYAPAFAKPAQDTLQLIDRDMVQKGYVDTLPSWSSYGYSLDIIKDFVNGLADKKLRDHLLAILAALEYGLKNSSVLGPAAVITSTSALLGALLPVVAKAPETHKGLLMKALGVLGALHIAVSGVAGTTEDAAKLFKNIGEAATAFEKYEPKIAGYLNDHTSLSIPILEVASKKPTLALPPPEAPKPEHH